MPAVFEIEDSMGLEYEVGPARGDGVEDHGNYIVSFP